LSQYGEHEFILQHFAGRDPSMLRFLDVGAFDGVVNSNTRPLADLGWHGVCVEPSPPAFCMLMANYESNPRVRLVNAALTTEADGLLRFQCNSATGKHCDQLSTFSLDHVEKWKGHPFRQIYIPAMRWQDLIFDLANMSAIDSLERSCYFDFVNIDVEGMNDSVFEAMPIRPEMVCVELDPAEDVKALCAFYYRQTRIVGGNILGWEPR
jgi:FkbM family methyltransferase